MFKQASIQMNFFHQTFCIPKTIQVVRFQAIQTIRMPNTTHQLVRFQTIQTIQTMYHSLVERAVFSVKSVLGINIFWVKKGL
ncbi:hypothetical protein Kazakh3190_11150 [Helicobacter pylori]